LSADKGNEYWKLRSTDGRDTIYTPVSLLDKSNEYFQWCIDNPLEEQISYHYQGAVVKDTISKMRPFTISGLCNFMDICVKTFNNYEKKEDFIQVTTRVKQIIFNQKFEGAAANLLNPNIIARDLGLIDRQDVKSDDKPLNQSIPLVLSDGRTYEDLKDELKPE